MSLNIKRHLKTLLGKFPILDGVFRRFIWSRIHFSEMEMKVLNSLGRGSIDVALDIGAALGSYSWVLNRVSNTVYAFEPGNVHSEYLDRLIFLSNIHVIRAAVGSECGSVKMYTPGADIEARHSATLSQANPVVTANDVVVNEVALISLDRFVAEELPRNRFIDVIKIDVEGYEYEVLKGANDVLNGHHPLIICEIEARHNAGYREVFTFLRGLGYRCFIYINGEFRPKNENNIEEIQKVKDLDIRLGDKYDPESNMYINNFVFQHPLSRVKVVK